MTAKPPTKVAILVRVSTNRQETDRQVAELQDYATRTGYNVVLVASERVSGAAEENERDGLKSVLKSVYEDGVKKVLVHEVSRLARRNSVAHRFVEELEQAGVSLYWHAQQIETLLPNGKRNPAASIMFSLLAEMARAERETLRERILSGMAHAAAKGRKPGRPLGSTKCPKRFLAENRAVMRQLRAGQSIRNTARICGVAKATVEKVKRLAPAPVASDGSR